MVVSAGTKLGPYEILVPIGAGGMGEVWKARDTRLGREVAIKISKQKFSDRFEREAHAVAALNHPNICTLYDVGPDYLVMEYVEGQPLKGPLPLEKAVEYAKQILEALDAAHQKGIVHRDLKPGNILVTKQGIKLLDFGLAKMIPKTAAADGGETSTMPLTDEHEKLIGTPQYMAPEQIEGKDGDARTDLFSFGCVFYEILTGKRAFDGKTTSSVIAAVLEREPAPLQAAPPLDRVVRRAMAKDPDQRFQTARDLNAALTWALEQPPPILSNPSRRWWMIGTAAIVLGAAIAVWAVTQFRRAPADERATHVQLTPPEGGEFVRFSAGTGGFALSPDGRNAAYVVRINGKAGLWVRSLDSATARLLPGTEGAGFPFWSPDNKSIGFYVPGKLMRVDIAGGEPLTICEQCGGGGPGAWTNDGRILIRGGLGLRQVPASGGMPSPLTTPDSSRGELDHLYPQVLPGGHFLYWVQSDKPENRGVYAASLAKPSERVKLLTTDSNAVYAPSRDGKGYLLWLRGSTLVAQEFNTAVLKLSGELHTIAEPVGITGTLQRIEVAPSEDGQLLFTPSIRNQFTWFDRAGKPLGTVGEPGEYITFRISPDGHRVVASRDLSNGTDLWMLDTDRGVASKFTFNGTVHFPVWSPDGRTVMYRSYASRVNLFRKDASGSGNEQGLELSPIPKITNDWSRDGRLVLYGQRDGLWVLPVTPEGMPAGNPRKYLPPPFVGGNPRFSPKPAPHWLAYESYESGTDEIYLNSFPEPRSKFQISTSGGRFPEWGLDGRELYYVSPDNKLMVVSLKLGDNSVEPSAPRELFQLPAVDPANIQPYAVAPDSRRFLVRVTQPPALNLIVNWPALLKKGAAGP